MLQMQHKLAPPPSEARPRRPLGRLRPGLRPRLPLVALYRPASRAGRRSRRENRGGRWTAGAAGRTLTDQPARRPWRRWRASRRQPVKPASGAIHRYATAPEAAANCCKLTRRRHAHARRRTCSFASSIRRPISAFSVQPKCSQCVAPPSRRSGAASHRRARCAEQFFEPRAAGPPVAAPARPRCGLN